MSNIEIKTVSILELGNADSLVMGSGGTNSESKDNQSTYGY
ncbi:hypothetical protein Cyrtocomes_01068 [Candidatus Cyrtobacter comes]|uniref:Lasso peptide n=1 Tax=Candidatus Cyrtobacter comes TaxID=675776 RepID=A0ABU5L978_9RICK|nr:hypothetical protein [Candidatus Cyrtobacter comes]MDZ5762677.1 hypothetical protein [Candidatus Cyrtobacter comes]